MLMERGESMVRDAATIDVTEISDLLSLAEEVRATGQPRVIRHDGEEIAVLMPIRARRVAGATTTSTTVRRGRQGKSVVERTAGALRQYAKQPPATIAEEKEAFVQGVAEEVAESLRGEDGTSPAA
jgi:hypothetical protein